MKGVILALEADNAVAVVLGSDEKRYRLPRSEWKSAGEPRVGMAVDFALTDSDSVKSAYIIPTAIEKRLVARFVGKAKAVVKRFKVVLISFGLLLIVAGLLVLALHEWHAAQFSRLQMRAEKGDAQAQYDLGECYFTGKLGQVKNFDEAVKCYRQAAQQNLAVAQSTLGLVYLNNNDEVEAIKWLGKAAEQDDCVAQMVLSSEYNRGIIVRKDLVAAYMWALLANRSLLPGMENVKISAGAYVSELESELSRNQIALGRQSASHFHSDHAQKKFEKGDWDGAIEDYTKAIEIDPADPVFFKARGSILYWQKQSNDRALSDFNRLIELSPGDVAAYTTRGNIWFTKDNPARAMEDYNKALELRPDEDDAFNMRGYTREMKLRDLDGALADYSKAVELDSNNITARKNLSELRAQLMANPSKKLNNANSYTARGNVKFRELDMNGAMADFNKAIELNPDWGRAFLNRAVVKEAIGDLDGAMADYGKAIELDPTLADKKRQQKLADEDKQRKLAERERRRQSIMDSGLAKQVKGDMDGAIADFTKVIEIAPNDSYAYRFRGRVKQRQGDLNGAMADYNAAIMLNNEDADIYESRGNLKVAAGDQMGALADYNKAIELAPDFARVYGARGQVKDGQGDLAGALADDNKAIELAPNAAAVKPVYLHRGKVKESQGDLDGAMADYRKAVELDPKLADPAWEQQLTEKIRQQKIADAEKQRQQAAEQEIARLAEAKRERLEAELAVATAKSSEHERQFQQLAASMPDSDRFANYSRVYASDFDSAWNSVLKALNNQGDKIASSDAKAGLIATQLTRHSIGINPYGHYDRYLISVERDDGNTTKIKLKLMRFTRTQNYSNDGNDSPYATITTDLRPDPQMGVGVVERQSIEFLDKIGSELKPR